MGIKQYAIIALIGFSLVMGSMTVLDLDLHHDANNDTEENPVFQNINEVNDERFSISQISHEGVIDPASILQSGYQTTDLSKGRTDTGTNTIQNITIDEVNGWFVNNTAIEVSSLKRLYGVNGTFDDGVEPWTNYTIDGGANTQIAGYDSGEEYITCRNVGDYKWSGKHTWEHSSGSEVGWEQTVNNSDGKLSFDLRFDFRYVTGPIDPESDNGFVGDIGVFWQINDDGGSFYEGYYYPMEVYVDSRDAWLSIEDVFTIPSPWSEFSFAVGLYLADSVTLDNVTDYDDDPLGLPDGLEHAQNLTLYIDNVEFTGSEAPTFATAGMTFHAGAFSEAITGSGVGTASISNPSYWTTDPLEIRITSSIDTIFTYSVTSQFHRYLNSSWTTDLSRSGVTYSISSGQSSDLTFYTYITEPSGYYNSTFDIFYPQDWENTTVWDPLANNITDSCVISTGSLHVPTSELSRSGWWEINLNGLNYAKNISVQVYDQGISDWSENSLFRPGNDTRVQVEIGTLGLTPAGGDPVNITWLMPDDSSWTMDSISSMVSGSVTSSSWTFGSTNTTAGEWSIDVLWTNGTEIAYESVTFDLYHSASISATYPIIETDYGLTISNLITYKDADTDEYLLDDSVTIEANWSSTIIPFTQNYAKNWWEADFDTSLVGGGQFTVIATASRPYFDPVSTQFTVISIYETTLEIVNAPFLIERGLNEVFTAQIDYEFLNGTGIPGALPIITFTGPGGGLSWTNFVDNSNGQYSVDIICDLSATYEVTITLSKSYHYNTSDSFTLLIGETGTELELLNGTSDVILFGESYRLLVEYRNSTGTGLLGADLQVVTVTPATGLIHANFSHFSNGYYEITFNTTSAGTYSVFISASILNHETQYATFTITATGIPTVLSSLPSSASIAVDQNFTVQLRFQDEIMNPIDLANWTIVNQPPGILISDVDPQGGGIYNFTLTPLEIGSFDLLFRASSDNYQSSSAAFTLSATEIPTILEFAGSVSSTLVEFQESFQLTVYYNRSDTLVPENVDGANLTVLVQDPGLVIDIDEFVGYYVVTIKGEAIGSWSLTISANKTDHHLATKQFLFQVEEIDTSIGGVSPMEALLIGRSYHFDFSYMFETNSSNIFGASVIPFGEGADWTSYIELGNGQYAVNLTPSSLGEYSVLLTFEKIGFETASYRLSFTVNEVPITVLVLQGLQGPEGFPTELIVSVTESDTGNPVSGATVYYNIRTSEGPLLYEVPISMPESTTPGVYTSQIEMPSADGIYHVEISCDVLNFVLAEPLSRQLQPGRDVTTMLYMSFQQYFLIYLGIGALAVGLVYRRSARKRRIRQNKITLAIKKRFDDVRSLLGVIVIHKDSGLPVYSKILRDGLEEAVISAFITAVTSFRGEFDIESSSEEWGLIPISDIVRVVSTDKLVCAFITTGNPSAEQRERMIQFAKTVGFIFDDTMEDVPIVVLDHHTTLQFDSLFDDILDGALLGTYKLDDAKKFPTSTCADERIAQKHGEEFKLEELATEIAACGLEEGRVYQAIMKALENDFLITTEDSPFTTDLIRAPETVEGES